MLLIVLGFFLNFQKEWWEKGLDFIKRSWSKHYNSIAYQLVDPCSLFKAFHATRSQEWHRKYQETLHFEAAAIFDYVHLIHFGCTVPPPLKAQCWLHKLCTTIYNVHLYSIVYFELWDIYAYRTPLYTLIHIICSRSQARSRSLVFVSLHEMMMLRLLPRQLVFEALDEGKVPMELIVLVDGWWLQNKHPKSVRCFAVAYCCWLVVFYQDPAWQWEAPQGCQCSFASLSWFCGGCVLKQGISSPASIWTPLAFACSGQDAWGSWATQWWTWRTSHWYFIMLPFSKAKDWWRADSALWSARPDAFLLAADSFVQWFNVLFQRLATLW